MGWIHRRSSGQWLGLILVLHLTLGVIYSLVTPAWESYDEPAHYQYVKYLATNRSLPDLPRGSGKIQLEYRAFSQPPLYYLLAALTTLGVDTSDNLDLERNPHVFGGRGGSNFAVHSGEDSFPYRSTFLAVHIARLLSVAISTAGVLVTFYLAQTLFPTKAEIILGATAITAFTPQFLFMGSVMNNDILVTLFSSLFLLSSVRVIVFKPRWQDFLAAGLFLGMALLSKYNALALLPLGFWTLWAALSPGGRSQQPLAKLGRILLLLTALALPLLAWLVPSSPLFGGPLRRFPSVIINFFKQLSDPLAFLTGMHWDFLPQSTVTAFNSFWALFGWANVPADSGVYIALGGITLLSAIGGWCLLGKESPKLRLAIFILVLDIALFTAFDFYRSLRSGVFPPAGRYLLPTISAVSLLLAWGLSYWAGRWRIKNANLVFSLGLFFLATITPFRYIQPAYAQPDLLSSEEVNITHPYSLNFGDRIHLLGYDLDTSQAHPGGEVTITLYLRGTVQMSENYTMSLHLLDPDQEAYTKLDTFPGEGNYATSLWEPGGVLRDTYRIPIPPHFPAPAYGQFKLAFFPLIEQYPSPGEEVVYLEGRHLSALGPEGEDLGDSALLARFAVPSTIPVQVKNPVSFTIDDSFHLVGYSFPESISPGQSLPITLFWQSLQPTTIDYQVFLHLVDAQGNVLAQGDSPPRNGFYPTSLWSPGEIIEDTHLIPLPPDIALGQYQLKVGMYRLDTLERLPITDEEGHRLSNDEIIIPGISME